MTAVIAGFVGLCALANLALANVLVYPLEHTQFVGQPAQANPVDLSQVSESVVSVAAPSAAIRASPPVGLESLVLANYPAGRFGAVADQPATADSRVWYHQLAVPANSALLIGHHVGRSHSVSTQPTGGSAKGIA
jgi:hypothetical protein